MDLKQIIDLYVNEHMPGSAHFGDLVQYTITGMLNRFKPALGEFCSGKVKFGTVSGECKKGPSTECAATMGFFVGEYTYFLTISVYLKGTISRNGGFIEVFTTDTNPGNRIPASPIFKRSSLIDTEHELPDIYPWLQSAVIAGVMHSTRLLSNKDKDGTAGTATKQDAVPLGEVHQANSGMKDCRTFFYIKFSSNGNGLDCAIIEKDKDLDVLERKWKSEPSYFRITPIMQGYVPDTQATEKQ